ncbi:MAG: glycosyltransferase family 9 protein [Candidatus Omnitrophica bacterium]|nr:glycosyltransferase family 9 protein [Candidatus Omnitrophota bacterium]
MNIKIMRYIDYWLGSPLCFLLSGYNWFLKKISFPGKKDRVPERILFIKLSEMGAIILAYPLLRFIKKQYPCSELFFLTFKDNRDIFKLLDGIIADKNILTINDRRPGAFILDTLKAIIRLRRKKINIIFDLEFFSRFSMILAYLINSDKRVGFFRYSFEGLYRGSLLTHKIQYNPLSHVTRNYLSMAQAITKKDKNTPGLDTQIEEGQIAFPAYKSKGDVKERISRKLNELGISKHHRVFLINPGEGILPLREWPLSNFIILCQLLLENDNNFVVLAGNWGALGKGEILIKKINNPRCVSLIGQTSLEELAELFESSHCLITNDCGLAHLAMLTSIKKFVIFGPESPQVFAPLGANNCVIYSEWPCSPCLSVFNHRKSACRDNKCLKNIKPDDIYTLIKESLPTN